MYLLNLELLYNNSENKLKVMLKYEENYSIINISKSNNLNTYNNPFG
tara:strand:+ start:862 stop:1002 length:141 start_codon:yes stop_codon:yes gene_type:complete